MTTPSKTRPKEKEPVTEIRKLDHIRICLEQDVEATVPTGFHDITLIHNAAPELNLDDVDLQTSFLGHRLRAPIMITAMTGGHQEALPINAHIAQAVETLGLAMGVGSQRAAIEDPMLSDSFTVTRKHAPTAFLVGNIGAPQLSLGYGIKEAESAINMLKANALAIHFNAAQEAVQPEGEAVFSGVLQIIRNLTKALPVPLIAKETGAGMSREVAAKLKDAGIKALDVAGLGGTSWPAVEAERTQADDAMKSTLGQWFRNWGIPTAVATYEVAQANLGIPLIASGGLRTGLDIAKAIALGAEIGGVALPVLSPAVQNTNAVKAYLESLIHGLKATMFLVGASTLNDLKKAPLIINGATRNWLELRGYNLEKLAQRSLY